jgi:hypothetical protein
MGTYNREQWVESFEGQLLILRPHLPLRKRPVIPS